MRPVDRRRFIGLTAGGLILPRFAIAQADDRPTITIAVQQVATSASLEVVRERSNVGERVQQSLFENLIARDLKKNLEAIPGLAESWKRIDDRTVELSLRKPAAANSGLRPKPGQARLKLGNSRDEEAVITINDQTIKLAADAGHLMMDDTGTDNSDLNLPPGRYKVTLKTASGAAQTRELDLVADETWGLVVGPDATPLPLRLY